MKARILSIALFFVAIFSSVSVFAQYDDLYYDPNTDRDYFYGSTIKAEPYNEDENDGGLKKPQAQNSYSANDDSNGGSDARFSSDYDNDDDEYYYSKRIRRNRYRSFDYGFWSNPWYDSYAYAPASIHIYNSHWNRCNSWNSWNSWGYDPWSYNNGWNSWGNNGWGNTYINNYYGGGYGYYNNNYYNSWNNNGWNGNGWNNNGWNNGTWNNNNGGGTSTSSNPKGTYTGPRTHGGTSTPAPPVKVGRNAADGTTNGTTTGRNTTTTTATQTTTNTAPTTARPRTNSWDTESADKPQRDVRTFDDSNTPSRTDRSNIRYQNEGTRNNAPVRSEASSTNRYETESRPQGTTRNNSSETESRPQRSYNPPSRSSEESGSRSNRSESNSSHSSERSTPSRSSSNESSNYNSSRSSESRSSTPTPSRSESSGSSSGRSSSGSGRSGRN